MLNVRNVPTKCDSREAGCPLPSAACEHGEQRAARHQRRPQPLGTYIISIFDTVYCD